MTEKEVTAEEVLKEYSDRFYNWVEPTGKALVELNKKRVEFMKTIYNWAELDEPVFAIVASPLQAQYLANVVDRALDPSLRGQRVSKAEFRPELTKANKYFKKHTLPKVFELFPKLKEVGEDLEDLFTDFEHAQKTGQIQYYEVSKYVSCNDLAWIGYYDFFSKKWSRVRLS